MTHTLTMPLWENPDASRLKSALAAEMTPLSMDAEAGNASFAGSSEVYWTDLGKCTCMDFHINQSRSAPCKHMVRLAMELGLLPSDGKKDDLEAAQYRVALNEIKEMLATGDLYHAIKIVAFLKNLYMNGESSLPDTRGIDTSPLRFFFQLEGPLAKPIKARKKDVIALVKGLEARLGEFLLSSPATLLQIIEEYDQADQD